MRIWTLHPRYLDARGLVALWREGLLAQAVLRGQTEAYSRHPQLHRFTSQGSPVGCLSQYLRVVEAEGTCRGYRFADGKIGQHEWSGRIVIGRQQLDYEWEHLRAKLRTRNPDWFRTVQHIKQPRAHPLFRIVPGPIAVWERI